MSVFSANLRMHSGPFEVADTEHSLHTYFYICTYVRSIMIHLPKLFPGVPLHSSNIKNRMLVGKDTS